MKINAYTRDDVAILEPVGKLLGGADVGELDEKLYRLQETGQKKVIVDLGKTPWIYSSSISILIHHYTKFREAGGNLKLANLTKKTLQIVCMTKLILVFDVYDTLEAALESFKE
ncbi:MAG: STAS domain-containing protein [Candidatus Zixiibacteriota bacterium]|nr:MAG: STAS domain-containing protein [candidate division Zixibacteria bacterium]